jgi:hypothetical protein
METENSLNFKLQAYPNKVTVTNPLQPSEPDLAERKKYPWQCTVCARLEHHARLT